MNRLRKKQGGFTLLELLIVIVIVGILAFLIVPSLTSGPEKARDSQRKDDLLDKIKPALETYYNENNSYPSSQSSAGTPTCVASDSNCLGSVLTSGGTPYMKTVPSDPKNTGPYVYTYAPTPSGCAAGACTSYTLTAQLENTSDSQAGANGLYTVNSAN